MGIRFDNVVELSAEVFLGMSPEPQTDLYGTPTYNSAWHAVKDVIEDMTELQQLILFQEIANERLDEGFNLAEVARFKTKLSLAELVMHVCQDVIEVNIMKDPIIQAESARRADLLQQSINSSASQ